MRPAKAALLALASALAILSLVNLIRELTHPWSPARKGIVEDHLINLVLFGIWPVWAILTRLRRRRSIAPNNANNSVIG